MAKSDEVERWFAETRPPSEKAMRRVRDIIVAADRRITEYVKYGTVQFKSDAGDFANFVQVKRAGVNLMLMRGGRLKGRYPHLEGGAVKRMRIADDRRDRADETDEPAGERGPSEVRCRLARF